MSEQSQVQISVVIPMYNEEATVAGTVSALAEYLGARFKSYEIVLSDDGSTDKTLEAAESVKRKQVRIVSYKNNLGKGSAVRNGILHASGDIVFFTDCDLAYGTEIIGKMYDEFGKTDAQVIIGSRSLDRDGYSGYGAVRRLMSKTYVRFVSLAAGFRHTDSQTGIKAFRRAAARKIFEECTVNGFAFDLECLIVAENLGYKIGEYPVRIINHREGGSKVHIIKDSLKMLSDVRKIRKSHKR